MGLELKMVACLGNAKRLFYQGRGGVGVVIDIDINQRLVQVPGFRRVRRLFGKRDPTSTIAVASMV